MPRKSTIRSWPADLRKQLDVLLKDERVSQLEATKVINSVIEAQGSGEHLADDRRKAILGWLDGADAEAPIVTQAIRSIIEWADGKKRKVAKATKSTVGRYSKWMDEIGKELKESREVAEVWTEQLGPMPEGQLGQLVNQILRTLSFDLSLVVKRASHGDLSLKEAPMVAEMLKDLALTTQRLEKASSESVKRTAEIRRQEREAAAEDAAKEAKKIGVSDVGIDALKEAIRKGLKGE